MPLTLSRIASCLLAAAAFAGGPAASSAETPASAPQNAFAFENPGEWMSIPPDLPELMQKYGVKEEDLWCAQAVMDSDWDLRAVKLEQLNSGLRLSTEQVKEGTHSGRWADLPSWPTIATRAVPADWSGAGALALWVYAEKATGDTITVGVRSDSPAVKGRGFFLSEFRLDWIGWKQIVLPLKDFRTLNRPAGWDKVSGLYLFAQAFGRQPNPYTVLYLDDFRLLSGAEYAAPPAPQTLPSVTAPQRDADGFQYELAFRDQPIAMLNHEFPEAAIGDPVVTPVDLLTHQAYGRTERALLRYYPRFSPGFPSFDPAGKAYIYSGDRIQSLDASGKWQVSDLRPVLTAWAKQQGWAGLYNNWGGQGAEPVVRFDRDGAAYVLIHGEPFNAAGERKDWTKRFAALLYSRDGLKSWQVYPLPGRIADFEKLDGHNSDCLKNPPVIVLSDYKHFAKADQSGYLLLPRKRADGTLELPAPVKFAEHCLIGNFHSGGGNMVLTHGDRVYVVYGWCPNFRVVPGLEKELAATGNADAAWTMERARQTVLGSTLPPIPADHPGLKLHSFVRFHLPNTSEYRPVDSAGGVPTFLRVLDRGSGKLSEPVFLGCGGGNLDPHNWPAITIDPAGILHVLVNGHHTPVTYTHTLKPDDASVWSAPEYLLAGSRMPNASYASLNCDRAGNLYSVVRSSKDTYNNRLALYRKKPGGAWEPEHSLVAPGKRLYHVWYQHMTYDAQRDRLFLTYFSQPGLAFLSRDMCEFLFFRRPEEEARLLNRPGGADPLALPLVTRPNWDSWVNGAVLAPAAGEVTTLATTDQGDHWHLATTPDFQ